jgi:hypothetical protein
VWTGTPTSIQVQWLRCTPPYGTCSSISGATGGTYTVAQADLGAYLDVEETAGNADGQTSATSRGTQFVVPPGDPPANTAPPKLSQTLLEVGYTLTVSPGTWTGTAPLTYTYTWSRCNGPCQVIPGQTGPSLKLTNFEKGYIIQALVTAQNARGYDSAYAGYYSWPVEAPGGGRIHNLGKAEAQLGRAAAPGGKAVSVRQLLKHNGYEVSFDWQGTPGEFTVVWVTTPKPGAKPIKVASADAAGIPPYVPPKVKVKLTAKGRSLLKHTHHLTVTSQAVFNPVMSAGGGGRVVGSLYPVVVTKTLVL